MYVPEWFSSHAINRFRRRVTIPQGVKHESVTSTMSPEGILTIMAPKTMLKGKKILSKSKSLY